MVDLREKPTCYIRSYTLSSMEATKIFESNRSGPLVAIFLDNNNHFKKSVEGSTKYCGNGNTPSEIKEI